MSEPSHIEKIKKLLRLAKSANQHEAELALQRAMELAAKHAVDLNELREAGDDGLGYRWIPCGARVSREEKKAKGVARTFFQVTTCMERQRYLLIGEESAMEVALYVIDFLVKTVRRFLAEYSKAEKSQRRKMTGTKRANFIDGFFIGILRNLHEHEKQLLTDYSSLAITLTDGQSKRNAKLNDMVGKTTTSQIAPRRKNVTAMTSTVPVNGSL